MDAFHSYFFLLHSPYFWIKGDCMENTLGNKKKRIYIQTDDTCRIRNMERVAGIEPASLAWKARGYSRR